MTAVQAMFGDGAHCERRHASQAQAIAYCKKDDTRVVGGLVGEWGEPKAAPGRTKSKLVDCARAIMAGRPLDEIREDFPGVNLQYGDKVTDAFLKSLGKRNKAPMIEIFVGVTGTGKSSTAIHENPGCYHAPWPTGGRWWWAGYEGQFCVILDEWRHQLKLDVMMQFLDRHPFPCEAKGRSFQMTSEKIIITTNIDPVNWYPNLPLTELAPLERRIQEFAKIFDFDADNTFDADAENHGFDKVERTGRFFFDPTVHAATWMAVAARQDQGQGTGALNFARRSQ